MRNHLGQITNYRLEQKGGLILKREVLHEWTEDEPWETWQDELGIHYKYKCSKCGLHTTTLRRDLFEKRLCYECEKLEGKG